jgi:tetratricopeptide (TPR) repeat protein
MKSNRWTAVAAAFGILAAADAFAQRGAVRGKIVDEEGKPLEGIECRIELHGGGGRASTVVTKKDGSFVKAGLQSGNYVVTCEKEGHRPLPIPAAVTAFEQIDLGTNTLYRLAPGELSEKDHARAKELLEKFNISAESSDHQATLNSLLELEKMMPESPEVQFNIASTYEKLENPDKALEHYRKTGELKPDFYDAWIGIAGIQGKKKAWPEAAAAMKKALDLKATDPIAWFTYAVYSDNSGDIPAAETAYRKTLELEPTRALAHYQLGVIEAGKGQNDAAIAHFEKFLELAPTDPQAEPAKRAIETLKQNKTQG